MRDPILTRRHEALTEEDFFLAGPPAAARRVVNRFRHEALVADIRRQPRRVRRSLAA